jgi:hypothetical protein
MYVLFISHNYIASLGPMLEPIVLQLVKKVVKQVVDELELKAARDERGWYK